MQIENTIKRIKKFFSTFINFSFYLGERSKKDNIFQISASLAYTSLVGIVPLLAIALAIFSAFPVFDDAKGQLQDFVFKNFAPHAEKTLQEKISNFVIATSGLTAVGVVGLVFTSVFMLNKIEESFNSIFKVDKPRTIIARMMMYWTMLTFCPLLIGTSFSFSGYVSAAKHWFQKEVAFSENDLNRIIPVIFFSLGFMLLYIAVPNRIVKIKHALIGGVSAALLFNILKIAFGYFVLIGSSYQVIYGALAALPLFLLWIYLSWTLVLFGAEITSALPEWQRGARSKRTHKVDMEEGRAKFVAIALSLIEMLWQSMQKTDNLKKKKALSSFNISEIDFDFVVAKLKNNGIIAATETGELVLTRDISSFTVLDLAEIFGATSDCDVDKHLNNNISQKVKAIFSETKKAESEKLGMLVSEVIAS
ncbi:MAG: YihY family inner membrane protein [Alphaproteobacteria bacterium]